MAEPFDRLIDSPIADMKNVGPREGGSITAAQFIKRFIENGVPLGAYRHGRQGLGRQGHRRPHDKGATGFGVRLLDQYVAEVCEKLTGRR